MQANKPNYKPLAEYSAPRKEFNKYCPSHLASRNPHMTPRNSHIIKRKPHERSRLVSAHKFEERPSY